MIKRGFRPFDLSSSVPPSVLCTGWGGGAFSVSPTCLHLALSFLMKGSVGRGQSRTSAEPAARSRVPCAVCLGCRALEFSHVLILATLFKICHTRLRVGQAQAKHTLPFCPRGTAMTARPFQPPPRSPPSVIHTPRLSRERALSAVVSFVCPAPPGASTLHSETGAFRGGRVD